MQLKPLTETTACVILETVQAENGIIKPSKEWIQALHKRCKEQRHCLYWMRYRQVLHRTGTLWAFEQFNIVPDILLLGKSPWWRHAARCFIACQQLMQTLAADPVLVI